MATSMSVLATWTIVPPFVRGDGSLQTGCIAVDQWTGEIYTAEKYNIISIKPSDAPSISCSIEAKVVINPQRDTTFGLAICQQTQTLYTASCDTIIAYSLRSRGVKSRFQLTDRSARFRSHVYGVYEGDLFFSTSGGRTLMKVKINNNGSLNENEMATIHSGFKAIRGVAFDNGNCFIADKSTNEITVIRLFDLITLKPIKLPSNVSPNGIAFVKNVLAVSDDENNCVYFLA